MSDIRTMLPGNAILVADLSGRSGGKSRRSVEIKREADGATLDRTLRTEIHVADVEEDREGQSIEQSIEAGLRTGIGTLTPFGWIVSPDRASDLDALVERARRRAEEFHERARHVRVHVGVARATIDLAQPEVVATIGAQIERQIREIRDLIKAGQIMREDSAKGEASAESALRFADQIPSLLVGQGRHVARLAIEEARSLCAQIKREAKERRASRASVAATVATPLLDACIALVSPDAPVDPNSDPLADGTIADVLAGSDPDLDALAGLV